jgi:serine/threonine protein kinase
MEDDDSDTVAETPHSLRERELRADRDHERYELGDLLGRGGMGEVIGARDDVIGRTVAIKRMLHDASDIETTRFLREARIQGGLDHPSIPPVYDLARDRSGRPFFVMKRLTGTTLADILRDENTAAKFPRQRLLRAFADACLAIELAHTRGVIHRDLKPSNIMLGEFGEVYVLDWGVAKVVGELETASVPLHHATLAESTSQGARIGTPGYMAPEQLAGETHLDRRADVYALGCLLFEILTLTRMHDRDRDKEIDRSPARRAPDRDVPPELDQLCLAATERDPAARLATARELGERVQQYLDGDRDLAQRRALARDHLGRANEALASDDEASQRTAMREAGRALALDPELAEAADLVGRLMLEPPREVPRDVAAMLEAEEEVLARGHARKASRAYLVYAGFIPILVWAGVRDLRYVALLVALLAICGWTVFLGSVHPTSRPRVWVSVLANAGLIAVLAHLYTPFMLAPGIATATTMISIRNPMFRRLRMIGVTIAAMCAAILLPLVAQTLGLVDETIIVHDHSLELGSPTLVLDRVPVLIGLSAYSMALIFVAATLAITHLRDQYQLQRRVHLQAWRLRQLVPTR